MGIPQISAPSEAEAQCAELVRGGRADAVATTDSDTLVFGAKVFVTNIFNALKGDPVEELNLDLCLKGDLTKYFGV
jgi:flap endonuclease-1